MTTTEATPDLKPGDPPRYELLPAPTRKAPPPAMHEGVVKVLAEMLRIDRLVADAGAKWTMPRHIVRRTSLTASVVRYRLAQMTACGWLQVAQRFAAGERRMRVYRLTEAGRVVARDYGCDGD